MPLGITEIRRDRRELLHIGHVHAGGDAALLGFSQTPDINGEQHIGGAVGALRLDALFETGIGIDDICLDTRFGREGLE